MILYCSIDIDMLLQTSSWCCGYTSVSDLSASAQGASTDASQLTVGELIGDSFGFSQSRSIPALQPLTEGQEVHGNNESVKCKNITLKYFICIHYSLFLKLYYILRKDVMHTNTCLVLL